MTRTFGAFLITALLACMTSTPAAAGPNAGGVMIVHDANLLLSATDGGVSLCGQGTVPPTCLDADSELDGAGNLGGDAALFLVYAAFFPGSSPRLMGVTWGVNYDANNIILTLSGKCGDFELNDDGWPAPGKGSSVTWNAPQTSLLVPVYWFAVYTYGNPGTFDLSPNPSQAGYFGDDSIPSILDPIDAFGKLGFDMPGLLFCPDMTPGACCMGTNCTITAEAGCNGQWMGPDTDCAPNPCCSNFPYRRPLASRDGNTERTVGRGRGVIVKSPTADTVCPGATIKANDDGSYENGYSWSYAGVAAPFYGAWAEGFTFDPGMTEICGVELGLTQVGSQDGWLMDVYVWDSASCNPNNVVCVTPGVDPGAIGMWPTITMHDIAFNSACYVPGDYFVGWWPNWIDAGNGWYVASDEDGFGAGSPRTNIAPGIGFPTGWNHVNVVSSFAACRDLGIRALVNFGPGAEGACCATDGSCTVTTHDVCLPPNIWHYDWASCTPNPCPQPGACCHPATGSCTLVIQTACMAPSVWQGPNTSCTPNPCPQPGACCAADGTCTMITQTQCAGMWMGPDTICDPNPCPPPQGACCHPDGTCVLTTAADCTPPNVWQGPATSCTPNPCPQPGACCASDGTCTFTLHSQCAGTWLGPGTSCTPNPCPQPNGACCFPNGGCTYVPQAQCTGQWLGWGTGCTPNPCPQPPVLGACCAWTGGCTLTYESACPPPSTWHAGWSSCTPNPCPEPSIGPNAGGTLIVHDAALLVSATDGSASICGQGAIIQHCPEADTEIDGSSSADPSIFKVYAAFLPGFPPRLMGVTWGVSYNPARIVLSDYGYCGDFELNDQGWPASGTGATVTWDQAQQSEMVRVYWFAGYTNGGAATLTLTPNPTQGGYFGDDAVPAHLDAIAGFGKLGFDTPGELVCPQPIEVGACCQPADGSCMLTTAEGCPAPGVWHPEWTNCHPNPCPVPPPPTGACCHPDGACVVTVQADCTSPNVWHANWPSCDPNPCPQPGACCAADGSCTVGLQSQCTGAWMGPNTSCTPNPCPQPLGACCHPDGSCVMTTQAECTSPNVWHSNWPSCDPNPCPQPGACCASDGTCTITFQSQCNGIWIGPNTGCEPNPCPRPGACCAGDGACTITLEALCNGSWQGPDTGCVPNPCPQPGACCQPDGSCTVTLQPECTGVWMGPGTNCTPNPCPQPQGACCDPSGACFLTTQAACTWPNIWQGPNTSCDPNPCPQPGACCTADGACTIALQSQCSGLWMGANTSCTPDPCPPLGACCAPNGTCTITLQALCNGDWLGPDAGCDPNPCPQPPSGACCYPDGHCVFTIQADCPTGDWHINVPCVPNPCQISVTGACCIGTNCTITTEAGCAGQWTGPGTTCTPNPCCRFAPPRRPLASHDEKTVRALGPGPTMIAPSTRTICPGSTFKSNDDGSYENGYAWAYAGVTPPYFGAWAEGYNMANYNSGVCGMKFALTQVGAQDGWLMDVYVWEAAGSDCNSPGSVLCVATGINPGTIGMWPTITQHDITIPWCCLNGSYFVGWWGNWVGTGNGWYVASDENGYGGGSPRTNIAPGIGYPTGWNHPNVVSTFVGCMDLGIGVYEFACGPTPTERMSWGRLKALYR